MTLSSPTCQRQTITAQVNLQALKMTVALPESMNLQWLITIGAQDELGAFSNQNTHLRLLCGDCSPGFRGQHQRDHRQHKS